MLLLQQRWFGLAVLTTCLAAQTFDAASVKPATPRRGRFEEPTSDPGRIHYPAVTLQDVILRAYDLSPYQLSGPDWLDSERVDIDATMPPGTTAAQLRAMLQHLLSQRFRLAAHQATREVAGYSLVVRNRSKLRESSGPALPASDGSPAVLKLGPDHYFVPPDRQGVFFQLTGTKSARSTFRQVTMREFAATLQKQLKRPVMDDTGLAGKYDFVLSYSVDGLDLGSGRLPVGPGGDDNAPDLAGAVSEQLGLKLESKKIVAEVLIIDHMERTPTGN